MKKALFLISTFFPVSLLAGGGSGGTPPSIKDLDTLELMSLSLEQLPKAYADQDEFRRANARLSVVGIETAFMKLEGESIQVRKLRDSIVDEKISKVILSQ